MSDIIANNVEKEIKKSNEIDEEESIFKNNSISNVLNLDPGYVNGSSNKDCNSNSILIRHENKLDLNKETHLEEGINQEFEEYLSADSDKDGI